MALKERHAWLMSEQDTFKAQLCQVQDAVETCRHDIEEVTQERDELVAHLDRYAEKFEQLRSRSPEDTL